jgi:predicted nucleic acid-binding protein
VAIYVFDSSALVKRYASEIGTAWVRSVTGDPSNDIYIARITGAEVLAAIQRKTRLTDPKDQITTAQATALAARFKDHFANEYLLIEITPEVVDGAMNLIERYPLRGYDGVQLAVARVVTLTAARIPGGPFPATLVSSDDDLLVAARGEGLAVEDPRLHP